ncbi:unnamed protein product [Fraxinus pennsylvanica]|uniref:Transmembrane protein n=1 Tax=Fraxinus pennsylvanica TaxID=56036 RepID=A0AAD2A2Z4_9LAMI|nr:unnamed protein product [Fraxinus pennsylvanica]
MARPLPSISMHKLSSFLPAPIIFFIILVSVLSMFSLAPFLCGSHKSMRNNDGRRRSVRLGEKNGTVKRMKSGLSSKALLMAKMISWRKVQDEEGGQEDINFSDGDEDDIVWKRTIIKGEKCRPWDFSGKILYDSNGNLLPDSPHHSS